MTKVLNVDHLIDGESVASESGSTFERRSPVTGEVVTIAAAGKETVNTCPSLSGARTGRPTRGTPGRCGRADDLLPLD